MDQLLHEERSCDVILPHINPRRLLEESGVLEPRVSILEEELESSDEDSDDEESEDSGRKVLSAPLTFLIVLLTILRRVSPKKEVSHRKNHGLARLGEGGPAPPLVDLVLLIAVVALAPLAAPAPLLSATLLDLLLAVILALLLEVGDLSHLVEDLAPLADLMVLAVPVHLSAARVFHVIDRVLHAATLARLDDAQDLLVDVLVHLVAQNGLLGEDPLPLALTEILAEGEIQNESFVRDRARAPLSRRNCEHGKERSLHHLLALVAVAVMVEDRAVGVVD